VTWRRHGRWAARVLLSLVLAVPVFGFEAQPTPAAVNAELRAQRAAARIQALQREADRLAAEARSVLVDLRRLELDRALRAEELAEADAGLADATAALEVAGARVEWLAAQRVAQAPGVEKRLVELYKRGRGGYARLLLGAEDVRDWGRMSRGVSAMARLDQLRLESHRRVVAAEREAADALAATRAEAASKQRTAAAAARELAQAVASRNRRLEDIDRRRDLAAQYVGELDAARRALQDAITALADGTPALTPVLPIGPFRGDLDWPIRGPLVSRFGRASSNRFGTAIVRNGIEVGAPERSPVRAVHDGTVAFAEPFTGYGTLVIVDHGNEAYSLYGHLLASTAIVGAAVERGAVLGESGAGPTGNPAVYFELRIDGRPVDPLQWLRSQP
jgi:murein hydrolase activator